MKLSRSGLQKLLSKNIVEIKFARRGPKAGWSAVRGMMTTTNKDLLNSDIGRAVLNFIPPKGVGMKYDYTKKNLCVGWDVFRQEYRLIPVENSKVVNFYPLDTEEQIKMFWSYFSDYIQNMSNEQKLIYMGYSG